jgi:hypothetical protein
VKRTSQPLILFLVFLVVFICHYRLSPTITSFDSRWSVHTARSILKEGNTDLDEYYYLFEKNLDYSISRINGHYYTIYPIGASLLALPFVTLLDSAGIDVINNEGSVQLLVASFIVGLTAVFIYLIGKLSLRREYAMLLTFIFAFCTSAWSTASRALWQHGPSMLMLSITLYLLLLARQKPYLAQYASLPLAFAYICRPTNSLSVILLTLFVLLEYRRYFVRYLLWSALLAIPFILFNFSVYHSLLSPYYNGAEGLGFSFATFGEGLGGTLLSPSRGLFIYSPVLLFSIWGIVLKLRQRPVEKLAYFLAGIILLHWFTISIWRMWWAGHSYGPRIFSDMIPYLIYFMIPVLQKLETLKKPLKPVLIPLFGVLIALSFLINLRGAVSNEVYYWDWQPNEVDQHPERLWDWNDAQFLRGLK